MPVAALGLAGQGQGLPFPPKSVHVVAANQIEPLGQLSLDPRAEGRVLFHRQFAHQGVGLGLASAALLLGTDPKVDQAAGQVGPVDPTGHGTIQIVRDQQRQGETAQHALGGPFPCLLPGSDHDQFSSKRE